MLLITEVILTLYGSNCPNDLIIHELGHVLGLAHTQMRPDRDCYIDINWKCLEGKTQNETAERYDQFEKLSCQDGNTHGTPYMCNSIMHYGSMDFSNDPRNCKSMTPKKD